MLEAEHQQQILDEAPKRFVCPLTLSVMSDPLTNRLTKHSFEASEILRWMYTSPNPTCPLTRRPIHPSDFFKDIR